MTQATINGDLAARVSVATAAMTWAPSPSPSVWRKRVHRVGPAESGQVTAVVRYEAGSQFPAHEHPDGEEILVLDGVFSDERGDWPAGTFLLNPEGFRHSPSSQNGCILFVKLRQYPGRGRRQVAIDTNALTWQPSGQTGVTLKPLYAQPGYSDSMALELWAPALALGWRDYRDGAELFVIDGTFTDEFGRYEAGTWLRLPTGAGHAPSTDGGCTLYVKRGGHAYLQSASGPMRQVRSDRSRR